MSEPAPKKYLFHKTTKLTSPRSVTRKEKKKEKKRAEKTKDEEELNAEDFEDKLSNFEAALLDKMNTETTTTESSDALRGLLSKLSHPSESFAPNPLSKFLQK
jgi:predicted RNA-binding protein Jag